MFSFFGHDVTQHCALPGAVLLISSCETITVEAECSRRAGYHSLSHDEVIPVGGKNRQDALPNHFNF